MMMKQASYVHHVRSTRRAAVSSRAPLPTLSPACKRVVATQAVNKGTLNGACMVELLSSIRSDTHVPAEKGGDLAAYVRDSPAFFSGVADLPMGGSLRPLHMPTGLFELTVPRIQLFEIWLQPRAKAYLRVEDAPNGAARLVISAKECQLLGSKHVEQFRLNERFGLDVAITITSHQPNGTGTPGTIKVVGDISVQVDMPPPFSFMPKGLIQTTGNSAMNATLSIMLSAIVKAMVKDYAKWSATRTHTTPHIRAHPPHHSTHVHQQQPHVHPVQRQHAPVHATTK